MCLQAVSYIALTNINGSRILATVPDYINSCQAFEALMLEIHSQ